jgi:hypothetical protein
MGIKLRRSNLPHGVYSRAVVLPANLEKGSFSTMACDRIILLDPRGQISEDLLLEFLEDEVEPRFWSWLAEKKLPRGVKRDKQGS